MTYIFAAQLGAGSGYADEAQPERMATLTNGSDQMQQREIEIVNEGGLDALASAKLTQLAAKYQCDVSLARSGRKVNAKSLMGVMMLVAGKGSRVVLETDGPDETEALDAIITLIENYFGEEE